MTLCPNCNKPTEVYLVSCDGHTIETHRCRDHGDVIPNRYTIPVSCRPPEPRRSEEPGIYRTMQPERPGSVWDGEGP